jgi:DNA-binding CsgD family transcriptional regulator
MIARTFGRLTRDVCISFSEGTAHRADSASLPEYADARAHGIHDLIGMGTVDPNGRGVVLSAMLPKRESPTNAERERWRSVITHLAAAHRLRRALSEGGGEREAVLELDGRVTHAVGLARNRAARERLRRAVQQMDRARGRLRRTNVDEALSLWKGLVAGRWSLVDHFDTDGRRFVVARKNDPDVVDPRALSARERQILAYWKLGCPLKHIAYTLGIAQSTVSRARGSAMKKLGCSTLAELSVLLRTLE